jgi:hypothetical protein
MSNIEKLAICAAKRPVTTPVFETRRGKLLDHLAEQLAMAEALVAGTTHAAVRRTWRIDEGGNKELVERPKRLRPWFWQDGTGKFILEIRYGAAALELTKGKRAIEVGDRDRLVSTIKTIIEAVKAGELDAAIEAVAAFRAKSTKPPKG